LKAIKHGALTFNQSTFSLSDSLTCTFSPSDILVTVHLVLLTCDPKQIPKMNEQFVHP
jgi:hypothetical protein